jgi:tRNA pseudouridine13 synthase
LALAGPVDDDFARRSPGESGEMTAILSSDTRPFLTAELPGTGGKIKESPEDFIVEETPAFPFSGEGDHTIFFAEKRRLTTFKAAEIFAHLLGIHPNRIGYAGLKDSFAVTRQFFSAERVPPEALQSLPLPPELRILSATRHPHKLRAGMLAGNRFSLVVRDCPRPENAERILAILAERGLPNYFGVQRFGSGRDVSAKVGGRLLLNDFAGALSAYVSVPGQDEPEQTRNARKVFADGNPREAISLFPPSCFFERGIIAGLLNGDAPERIFRRVFPKHLLRLFLSSVQSGVFNSVLERRISSLDSFLPGDIGMFSIGATFFRSAQPGDPRLKTFEVSPSGPIAGWKAPLADEEAGEIEREVLASAGFSDLSVFRASHLHGISLEGTRRRLRVRVSDISLRIDGRDIHISFFLPKGSYATEVLREVLK